MNAISRRKFLFSMLGTGAALTFGSVLYFDRDLVTRRRGELLDPQQETVLRAFIPAILEGVLSKEAELRAQQIDRLIVEIEHALKFLPEFSRAQFLTLLTLLSRRLSRWLLAGELTQLDNLSIKQRTELLQSWRESFLALLQQAYLGLRDIVLATWYSEPESWALLNYKKPSWVEAGR
jgi:hypothetical protein